MPVKRKVIVIGGGAAGMMAAGAAGFRGLDVLLLDKNKLPGRKLLITGKGRCNVTNNAANIDTLVAGVPVNGKFLYSAFSAFSNHDLRRLLQELGLQTKVERGGRVFPVTDRAADVVRALRKYLQQNNVDVFQSEVHKIEEQKQKGGFKIILRDERCLTCESVILATGGMSYPQTGSTGDGYRFAKECGHTVMPLKPALVPLEVEERWVKEAQGLTLKNVAVTIVDKDNRKIYNDFGEMLFTGFGVSGPVILSASSFLEKIEEHQYRLLIDLKPALSEEQLDRRIQRDFIKYANRHFANSLNGLLPKKLISVIVKLSKIPPEKPVHQVTKSERRKLLSLFKNLTLKIKDFRPLEEAIVTAGGVSTAEIDPHTMESKIVKGLYFAGEIIDVNAYTGGFNLQIAFSTGYLAGINC